MKWLWWPLLYFCSSSLRLPPPTEGGYVFGAVCLFVGLSVGLLASLWTDFDEILWRGRAWLKDQVIQFWWRSGSRFGSGSPMSEIRIIRIGKGLFSVSAFLFILFFSSVLFRWSFLCLQTLEGYCFWHCISVRCVHAVCSRCSWNCHWSIRMWSCIVCHHCCCHLHLLV